MTRDDAKQALRLFSDTPDDLLESCVHGHLECSTSPGGDCLDAILGVIFSTNGVAGAGVDDDGENRPG
jgi:hypothetical protein